MSRVVLITGCSTGLGRDLAVRLAGAGYQVAASARDVEKLAGLPAALKLALDVTRPESVEAAVEAVLRQFGRIDALVNNAGYALRGALEEVPVESVREMFEVNVLGVLRMIRAVAPHMRRQGSGRIINLSSIAGRVSTPVNGAYSATKFALEALSDALRLELAPFGIAVVTIEPGAIRTQFNATALAHTHGLLADPDSPYRALYQKVADFDASMRQQEFEPEAVSRVIQQALEAPRPKKRYLAGVTPASRLVLGLRDLLWDTALKRMFTVAPERKPND